VIITKDFSDLKSKY